MSLTAEQKQQAKDKLRQTIADLDARTLSYWLHLFECTEEQRKHCGYSQGPEDMIQKLVKVYRKEHAKLMKPFDRGDYD